MTMKMSPMESARFHSPVTLLPVAALEYIVGEGANISIFITKK